MSFETAIVSLLIALPLTFAAGVLVGIYASRPVSSPFPSNYNPELVAAEAAAANRCWELLAGDVGAVRREVAMLKSCEKDIAH